MGDYALSTSVVSASTTVQEDERNFAEGGAAVAGQGSSIAYPTSVSVFGSPGSNVGDISFVSHAPAERDSEGDIGLSDQLSGIMSNFAAPTAMPGVAADKPNYIMWAGIAIGAFLLLKGIRK